jgi:multicomponent Na+:H+ antiporter subunit E
MPQTTYSTGEKVKGFAWLFGITLVLWCALTSTLNPADVVSGCVVCLIASLFATHIYSRLGLPALSIRRILIFFVYIIVLLWEIIKANFDVAYRVIHPKMPIKPGIVVIETHLKSDIAKMILANSITLTPGTFTLDVIGDKLLIHWINVKAEDIDEATSLISRKFEKYLSAIFT